MFLWLAELFGAWILVAINAGVLLGWMIRTNKDRDQR